jgi:hypothetical protein
LRPISPPFRSAVYRAARQSGLRSRSGRGPRVDSHRANGAPEPNAHNGNGQPRRTSLGRVIGVSRSAATWREPLRLLKNHHIAVIFKQAPATSPEP